MHLCPVSAKNDIEPPRPIETVTVSLDVVWLGASAIHDARMSEISMEGCFIDCRAHGRVLGDTVGFKVRKSSGPWVSLQGELVHEDYPMGFGLRFKGLSEGDKRFLAQVVIAHGGDPGALQVVGAVVELKTPERASVGPRRVLVADDDSLSLRMMAAIVESEGYQVVTATDGREALRILQQDTTFFAALFDMKMPHLQGLDLILHMKGEERLQHIPVGLITAERDPKVWDDSVGAGACAFLPKPFTPPQVQMMLRMLASKAGY
jgi:CheY-like chemotaxis protein